MLIPGSRPRFLILVFVALTFLVSSSGLIYQLSPAVCIGSLQLCRAKAFETQVDSMSPQSLNS